MASRWSRNKRRRDVLAEMTALVDLLEATLEEARALPPAEPAPEEAQEEKEEEVNGV